MRCSNAAASRSRSRGAERGVGPARLRRLEAVGVRLLPLAAIRHRRFDTVVLTDRPQVTSWRSTRFVYLHHGSSFGSSESHYAFRLYAEGQCEFLLALHPGERELAFAMFGPALANRVRVVGQPKLDRLANRTMETETCRRALSLDPGRKTVLVTSHWTPTSLMCTCGESILAQLRVRRDLNVLVTAHHHLWAPADPRAGGVDWCARLAWVGREPHMRLLPQAPDVHALMSLADVMIGDHSSATLECAVLGRPLLVFLNPAHQFRDPELVSLIAKTASVFRDPAQLPTLLDQALEHPGIHAGRRERLLAATFAFLGTSADEAARAVEDIALSGRL